MKALQVKSTLPTEQGTAHTNGWEGGGTKTRPSEAWGAEGGDIEGGEEEESGHPPDRRVRVCMCVCEREVA